LFFLARQEAMPTIQSLGIFGQKKDLPNRLGLCTTVELLEHRGRNIKAEFLDRSMAHQFLILNRCSLNLKQTGEQNNWLGDGFDEE
jgi:hypothetical protein